MAKRVTCKWNKAKTRCTRYDGWQCELKKTTEVSRVTYQPVKGWRGMVINPESQGIVRERFFKNKVAAEKWCRNTRIGQHG